LKPDQFGVDNEGNNLTNTSITAGATSAGAKMKVIGVGLRHSF
jgi:hypothetical protein